MPQVAATRLARPGGHIANIGVHGEPATLHLEDLWIRNLTITTGLVDTSSTPTLLRLAQGHQMEVDRFITHRFTLDQFRDAVGRGGQAQPAKLHRASDAQAACHRAEVEAARGGAGGAGEARFGHVPFDMVAAFGVQRHSLACQSGG